MIGRENIEEKMFEYFEGLLSGSEAQELEHFVKENPEFQADFDAWKNTVVADPNLQYEYAGDLVVDEKSSPKGWLKWSAGSALMLLVALTSFGLVQNFKTKNNEISDFSNEEVKDIEVDNANNEVEKESSDFKSSEGSITSEVVSRPNTLNERQNEQPIVINLSNNSNLSNNRSVVVSKDAKTTNLINNHSSSHATKNVMVTNSKLFSNQVKNETIVGSDELNSEFSLAANKWMNYEFTFSEFIKDKKFKYNNPNKPSLFFKNFRDPYLNYNLAQTLEENGSFAGNGGDGIRVEALYRTEWPSATKDNFTSQIISVDGYVKALKGGLGVLVNADRIGHGKLNATAVSLIYSPKIKVGNISVEPSMKYTYNKRDISWGQVTENDVKDPRNGVLYASVPFSPDNISHSTLVYHDFGLGLLLNANSYYVGGQIDHMNRPTYSNELFDQDIMIPYKLSVMAGTDILKKLEGNWMFSPSLNYVSFGNYNALWGNIQSTYKTFFVSGAVATNEEIMMSIGFKNEKVRLVYGLGLSKPSEFSGLDVTGKYYESHQLSLRVNLQPKTK